MGQDGQITRMEREHQTARSAFIPVSIFTSHSRLQDLLGRHLTGGGTLFAMRNWDRIFVSLAVLLHGIVSP
jgi:hypothetical protein